MTRDLLSEVTRALREPEEASEFEARATRTRVMTGLHQTRIRRRTRLAFILPLAASFVAATTWAATNGAPNKFLRSLRQLVSAPAVPAPQPSPVTPRATAPQLAPPLNSPAPVPAPVPVPVPALSPSPPSFLPDPTLPLYRAAHTAHFVDHEPSRALHAWDAYLAAAPNGQLAPEARYNRALSLVRLGRTAEARTALQPFASGNYAGYRQAEANALLERLEP